MGVAKAEVEVGGGEVAVAGADGDDVRGLSGGEREAVLDYIRGNRECSVREACEHAGVRRKDVRAVLKSDAEFLEDYRTARGYGAEQIFTQMVKLAIEGVEEPVVSGGKQLGTKRVYSERLLQTMFSALTEEGKAALAGKLGLEISGPDGGPVKIERGVSLVEVAGVLAKAGVDLAALARPQGELVEGEVLAEADEPA